MTDTSLGAIILAAGKGKRMQTQDVNKVTLLLNNKPLVMHIIEVLEHMHISSIIVVVGHAKESVMNVIKSPFVTFAEQAEQLGTGHAASIGLKKVPSAIEDVFIMYGDDSFFYNEELLTKLSQEHQSSKAAVTMLTVNVENPQGLGRIVRDDSGKVIAVIEDKDATDEVRNINEINPACYIFKVTFLKKYLSQITKSPVTGEYYLPNLIDMAIKNGEKVSTVKAGFMPWRGVNTRDELAEAEQLLNN